MWEAAQAPTSASSAPELRQAGKRLAAEFFPIGCSGAELFISLYLHSGAVKLAPFVKTGGLARSIMGDILAAAGAIVNDRAHDIPAFIDLSALIRDFLCKSR